MYHLPELHGLELAAGLGFGLNIGFQPSAHVEFGSISKFDVGTRNIQRALANGRNTRLEFITSGSNIDVGARNDLPYHLSNFAEPPHDPETD